MNLTQALEILDISGAYDITNEMNRKLRASIDSLIEESGTEKAGTVPLTISNGVIVDLSPKLKSVLRQVFERFQNKGGMGQKQMSAYSMHTSGQPLPKGFFKQMQQMFSVNERGQLTFEGFSEFYPYKTRTRHMGT